MPVSPPRVCPVLVERDAELAALTRLLADVVRGDGRFAFIVGEAGAGKSRLTRELGALAAEQGFARLVGTCTERDRDFPFAPIIDALRQRLAEAPEAAPDFLGPQEEALAALLPELRPGVAVEPDVPDRVPEQTKRRYFEVIVALLGRLAAAQPLLLLLEDLHWADPTSVELLELLPRRLAAARLFVVGTARSDEPDAGRVRPLAALTRARPFVELSLNPLTEQGVARMLERLLPSPPSVALAAAVHARTDGNPFFVEELLASAPPGKALGWMLHATTVPFTVQDAVLRRLDGLDAAARSLAELAAVAAPHLSVEVLRTASGLPNDDLGAALAALLDRRLLVEDRSTGRARFAFRHALTRDAIRECVRWPRRRALHLAVANALVAGRAATDADLGFHFHAAEEWAEALVHAARAGDAARRLHATIEALDHDRRALSAALALDPHHPRAARLHLHCGQDYALLGAFDDARSHLDAALRLARLNLDAADATAVEADILAALAALYASRDYREAERLAEEALAVTRARDDPRRQALAANRLGNVRTNLGRFGEGLALHEDALARFRALGDRWGSADSLDLIGMTRLLAGQVPEAREAFAQAATIFAALNDAERTASALTSHGVYLAVLEGACESDASPEAFRADAERGLRLCEEIGWRGGEAYARVAVAGAELGDGRYREALEQAVAALTVAEEIGHQQWQVIALQTLGLLHVDLLDDARALARFERALDAAKTIGSIQWVERAEVWIACCRLRLDAADSARDLLVSRVPADAKPASLAQRRAMLAVAEWELANGRPERALPLADALLAGAAGPRPAEPLLLRAKALAALDRLDDADAALLEARRLALAYGPASLLWRVAAARARLWRARQPEVATAEAAETRARLIAVAEAIPDDTWRAGFLAAPEVAPWLAPVGRRRTAHATGPGGLTPREREVANHVARGRSNKEIARDLFLAEKTVEMHVGSCLAKLGFASRVQLAAWAVNKGLAPEPPTQGQSGYRDHPP